MKTLWILYDQQKTGTYRQCLGLTDWLQEEYQLEVMNKPIQLKRPYCWFPPQFMQRIPYGNFLQKAGGGNLSPPYPDLVIAGGRQAINVALTLRKICKTIVVQNPRLNSSVFDLVIPPYHDQVKGENVISTLGALHPIRPQQLESLRSPTRTATILSVLIGGDSRHYRFTPDYMIQLAKHLRSFVTNSGFLQGAHLCVSSSRRSRPELIQLFKQNLEGLSYELWEGEGDNPYLRYLANADALIVTGDSVSMMSEACITGKPVYIYELPQERDKATSFRLTHFTQSLYQESFASQLPKEPPLHAPDVKKLDELERLKPELRKLLAL